MKELTINISDYLTQECIENEIRTALRAKITAAVQKDDLARIISNTYYNLVFNMVDEAFEDDLRQMIIVGVKNIIENLSTYCVFREKSLWREPPSLGQTILDQAVQDNAELIEQRVKELIAGLDKEQMRESLHWQIEKVIERLLTTPKEAAL